MKRFIALIILACIFVSIIPMTVSATETSATAEEKLTVVFLKYSGGSDSNDGKTADTAVQTFGTAYDKLDLSQDCTVVVCGEVGIGSTFSYGTEYTGSVTFTSVYDDVNYAETNNAKINTNVKKHLVLWGDTIFDNITLNHKGAYFITFVQGHSFTITESVTMTSTDSMTAANDTTSFLIVGGFQSNVPTTDAHTLADHSRDSHITVLSGDKIRIGMFNRNYTGNNANDHSENLVHSGDCYVTVGGTATVSRIFYDADIGSGNVTSVGNAIITVKDSAVVGGIAHTTADSGKVASLTVNYLGGTIKNFYANGKAECIVYGSVLNYVEGKQASVDSLFEKAETATTANPEIGEQNPFKNGDTYNTKKLDNVEFIGYQTTPYDSEGKSLNVRLVSVITEADISNYQYVGFKVKLQIGDTVYDDLSISIS